ncbi:MAG: YihY/virulence factor BrkB family protein [Butyrivibrio sp.]|nr:YihY/virulence factor BrkB family protein [Butyrivibrio sp.]
MKGFNLKRKISLIKDFSADMQKKNIDILSASTAFFLILSLIPLLILLASTLLYTQVTEDFLIETVLELTPDFVNDTLIQMISEAYEKTISTISISAFVTIWAGALGMLALIRGLNNIYEVVEHRNYFLVRLIATLYTISLIAIILIMLVLLVFGNIIKMFLLHTLPHFSSTIIILSHFKYLIIIGIATLLFALIYTYVPNIRLRYIHQLPGAFFSAVVWYFFSWLFSIYVNNINNYSLYGSLSTPIIIMFWLYFCIYIFFIGAFINHFLRQRNINIFRKVINLFKK